MNRSKWILIKLLNIEVALSIRINMPVMKRTSKKAQKIADKILGTPQNMQSTINVKRKKSFELLENKDYRLIR